MYLFIRLHWFIFIFCQFLKMESERAASGLVLLLEAGMGGKGVTQCTSRPNDAGPVAPAEGGRFYNVAGDF